eukprot:UN04226
MIWSCFTISTKYGTTLSTTKSPFCFMFYTLFTYRFPVHSYLFITFSFRFIRRSFIGQKRNFAFWTRNFFDDP